MANLGALFFFASRQLFRSLDAKRQVSKNIEKPTVFATFNKMNGGYTEFWHALYNNSTSKVKNEGTRLTTKQLFIKHNIMPLQFVLRKLRIAQLSRMVRRFPPLLKALIQLTHPFAGSWISAVVEDLEWLYVSSPKLASPGSPTISLAPWIDELNRFPNLFLQLVDHIHKDKYPQFYQTIPEGLTHVANPAHAPIQPAPLIQAAKHHNFQCTLCSRGFKSTQGLACHRARAHNMRNPVQMRISTVSRPHCNKSFLYTYLNLRHINSNPKCKQLVLDNCSPLDPQVLASLIKEDNVRLKSNVHNGLPRSYAFSK